MNSLTVALASLGGIVLAGVIAHGAWQARRAGPKRAAAVVREEPSAGAASERDDAALADDGNASIAAPVRRVSKRMSVQLDALIDAFAPIALEAPIAGDAVLAHAPSKRHVGSKLVLVEGLELESGRWEAPAAGKRYGELQAGVQLASRTGPLNEIEYSEFVQRMQAFAEAIGASLDPPDMLEVMARARELDAFASEHDAQLAVHLRARGAAWSVGYIQQHARRHGFVPGVVPGRLVYPAAEEGGPPVLTLTFDPQAALADEPDRAAVRDVTLAFDVPQTAPAAEPFRAWQAAAQALAVGMDAEVSDDDGRPLTSAGFDAIGADLGRLYQALEARDLAAGTPTARRLFS